MSVEDRAESRRLRALDLLAGLDFFERWGRLGSVELTGAVRHGLVVARDIDIDVTVASLDPVSSFAVVGEIAADPRVVRALYRNDTATHGWLSWELGCRLDDGEEWTIETYVMGPNARYAGWTAELALAFDRALTPEHRHAVLDLKEALVDDPEYRSMDIYRAVVDGGVRELDAFKLWRAEHGSDEIVHWLPGTVQLA